MEKKGTMHLGEKVMISDPCYGLNTWCQGVLENVLPGEYECSARRRDNGYWGGRVDAIKVVHRNYINEPLNEHMEEFAIGVDSGQAGIFDYEYYEQYHTDANDREHVNDNWYKMCCDTTSYTIENPNFKPFNWDEYGPFDELNDADDADRLIELMKKFRQYRESDNAWRRITKPDAGVIDGHGFVSSSGDGDGCYNCWTAQNADGKTVSIRVEFVYDGEEEE